MGTFFHFGITGVLLAWLGSAFIVAICLVGYGLWLFVTETFEFGYGWIIWTALAIAAVGFVGGVIFPFLVPSPEHQDNTEG